MTTPMPKLIDAEAAKEALRILARSEASYGTIERAMKALDALPDASEWRWEELRGRAKGYRVVAVAVENQEYIKAIDHILDSMEEIQGAAQPKTIRAERIPVPPHLAEAQRVVINRAAQPQEGE